MTKFCQKFCNTKTKFTQVWNTCKILWDYMASGLEKSETLISAVRSLVYLLLPKFQTPDFLQQFGTLLEVSINIWWPLPSTEHQRCRTENQWSHLLKFLSSQWFLSYTLALVVFPEWFQTPPCSLSSCTRSEEFTSPNV